MTIIKLLKGLLNWRTLSAGTQHFMFNSGTKFVETASGLLLLSVSLPFLVLDGRVFLPNQTPPTSDYLIALAVGLSQLLIAPILCRGSCWATRGLLAAVSGVMWAVIAARAWSAEPPEHTYFIGAGILALSMFMAVINLITSRNTVDLARESKQR